MKKSEPLKVGVTGGIGSGKSTVCKVLEAMNFPVYYSDHEAKSLVNNNQDLKHQLISLLGKEIYESGQLNRPKLAELIFNDFKLKEKVNGIIHPAVREHFKAWILKQKSDIIFNEAAILFETGAYQSYDKMILVTAPEAVRINRVQQRDGSAETDIKSRMQNQWSDDQKIPLADYVITNDDKEAVLPQILHIIEDLKSARNQDISS